MRRKRRGEYQVWNATIEAALSVGIVIESGPSEEKPLIFLLPETDDTYFTRDFHPMKREVFDAMVIDEKLAADFNEDECDDAKKTGKARKRQREPIFVLDSMHAKFLKNHQEATTASTSLLKSQSRSSIAGSATDGNLTDDATRDDGALTPARRPPQKWSALEKKVFLETLEKNGRNWSMLSQAVGTKSISQIKNFFYDYKKQVGRGRGEKKLGKEDGLTKLSNRENDMITPPPDRMSPLEETPATSDFSLHEPPLNVRDPERQLPSFPSYQSLHPILTQSQQEMQQLPIPTLDQSQTSQQDQHNLHHHHYHIGSGDLLVAANVMQMDNVNNLPHSGTSTPDAMDLWAQAHQHALAQQDQLTEEAARRLLQHHSQSQHQQQQLLSLLPWVNSGQLSHSNSNSMQDHQQIQSLLQLQHHPQQQQQAQHRQQPQNNFSHLAAMGLGGLAALTNSPANMASLGQQQLHHQHHHPPQHLHSQRLHPHDHHQQHHSQQQHHHQQQQQQQHAHHHQRQSSHDAQLVLAQHLLNLQAQSGTSAADALSILARSLPDPNRNGNGNKQNGNFHGGGI